MEIWNFITKKAIKKFNDHKSEINSIKFSPNGKELALALSDGTIEILDLEENRKTHTFEGHSSPVSSISFNTDGSLIASAASTNSTALSDNDNSSKIWSIKDGTAVSTFIGGNNGVWMSYDSTGNLARGDNGDLLLEKNGDSWVPALPKSFDKTKVKPPKLRRERTAPIEIASGETQDLTFEVTNTSQQTLYWPKIELAEDSPFSRYSFPGEAPNIIEPGKTTRIHTKIGAHTNNPPQPTQQILKLRLVAPNQTASEWLEIPVQVNTPQLEITEASLLKDENIIKVRIDNKGTQAINNTFYKLDLNLPDTPELDTQNAQGTIEPNSFIERSFSLPPDFKLPKNHQIKLDVRNAALPFMYWEFSPTLILPKPPIWMYAGLALLALLSATGIFYFRRYRHPLLVGLSEQPENLLTLPLEQLLEAQQRLQQTKRLETVLSDVSVSPKTLRGALDFNNLSAEEKAEYINQRVGGVLENTLTPQPPLPESTVSIETSVGEGEQTGGTIKAPRPMRA